MFLLDWSSAEAKTVEGGIDRVVLYAQNSEFGTTFVGTAWPGVVGITYSELETVQTTFYDGRPIRQRSHSAGISGTIEAYTTPDPLQTKLAPGVIIGGQPIPITHLSYRTVISNANQEPTYAITLAYAVSFQSAEAKAQSFDKDPNVELKQWSFSAYPRFDLPPYDAPSNLTIRTDEASPALVVELEKRLYGQADVYNGFAYMPPLSEIVSLVENFG
jgi:hypothetical protein